MAIIDYLGIENAIDSKYAQSKLEGENTVRNNFRKSIIFNFCHF